MRPGLFADCVKGFEWNSLKWKNPQKKFFFRRFKKNFNLFIYFSRLVSNPNTLNPTSNVRFGNILIEYLFFHYFFKFFWPKVPDQKFRLCQILGQKFDFKNKNTPTWESNTDGWILFMQNNVLVKVSYTFSLSQFQVRDSNLQSQYFESSVLPLCSFHQPFLIEICFECLDHFIISKQPDQVGPTFI